MFQQNNLFKKLSIYKNKIALISEDKKKISYSDLFKKSKNLSSKLKNSKSLIFLLAQNNIETVVGYISFIQNSHAVVFLDYRINDLFLKKLISSYKPNYIFCKKNKKIKSYKSIFEFDTYALLEKNNNKNLKIFDELMLLMPTSGSTGSSKFVRQSYKNIEANTQSIIKFLKIKKKDVTITSLPISYVYGLSIVNTHLLSGATIIMTNKSILENSFWDLVNKYKISSLGGVPFQYNIIERIFKKNVPRSLKYTTQAGGKMNNVLIKNIIKIYKKNNIKFIQMYGAAEATSRMSYLKWHDANKKIGSIGKSIPGGKLYIEQSNGRLTNKAGVQGELVYKGKNVCLGYSEKLSDLALPNRNNEILKTGDIAYKDRDGFFYIVGRKNRYAKIYGSRVNLSELENLLSKKGIDVIMKVEKDDQILSFFRDKNDIKKGIKYISKLTMINAKVFIGKTITKKNITKNFKFKL